MNIALKWNFASFWHDYGIVNLGENYKKYFLKKNTGSERSSKMNSERSAAWVQIFFSLRSHVVNVVAVVMTQSPNHSKMAFHCEDSSAEVLMLVNTN